MSTRISDRAALAALIVLAACSPQPETTDTQVLAEAEANQSVEAADDGRILCAVDGAGELARTCTLDREEGAGGLVLTVRHPDGGFHRLAVTRDGRGVAAADGAEAAEVTIVGPGEIEVRLDDDVYRLPATIRPRAAAAK